MTRDELLPTFNEALADAKQAGDDMHASDPESVATFHAAWLNVRRTIHRDYPNQYGDPDQQARADEIRRADELLGIEQPTRQTRLAAILEDVWHLQDDADTHRTAAKETTP